MPSLIILADDYTSACDTGLQFAKAGLHTVACETDRLETLDLDGIDVIVCDTETRNVTPSEARGYVTEACGMLRPIAADIVYKKVDSALRGHIAAEIYTVMSSLDLGLAILAPAFPAAGRVTVGGYHLVHGVPVHRTEAGHDAGAPVRGSFLPHLLEGHPDLDIRLLPLEDVAQGPEHVGAIIDSHRDAGRVLIVADAASEEDLATIATAASRSTQPPLLCGSAGLAGHLARAFSLEGEDDNGSPEIRSGPSLVVVGTHESVTRAQIDYLRNATDVPEWEVHADHAAFAWERPHVLSVVAEVSEHLKSGKSSVLSLVGLHAGMQKEEASDAVRILGQMAARVLTRTRPAALVASGGWTAVEILRAIDATAVRICESIDVGSPLCEIIGGKAQGMALVTKGGALGEQDTFEKAVNFFQEGMAEVERPLLAITMGDVCGVGPEVIAKGLSRGEPYMLCRPFVIGDAHALEDARRTVGATFSIRSIDAPEEAVTEPGVVEVLNPVKLDPATWCKGDVSRDAGRAAAEWVMAAVDLAVADRIDGIVTAPLNKEAMNLAGYAYPGHTELLAEQAGGHDVRLMLASERMSVAHVTGHVALHDVPERLTQKRVFDTIRMTRDALIRMGRPSPKLAVTGLNPHAGENGLFGEEDDLTIRPAVEQGRQEGWAIDGPLPADATYFKAYDGDYDGVVAMYHDQGHVPMKLVAFDTAVNVTLGLPIVRTSVDHGTAFDIAGTGKAKEGNLIHAIRVGAKLALGRKREKAAT